MTAMTTAPPLPAEPVGTATRRSADEITRLTTKYPGLGKDLFVAEHEYNQAINSRDNLQQLNERGTAALKTALVQLAEAQREIDGHKANYLNELRLRAAETARADANEKDARRLDWLREHINYTDEIRSTSPVHQATDALTWRVRCWKCDSNDFASNTLDAAIDAALAKS